MVEVKYGRCVVCVGENPPHPTRYKLIGHNEVISKLHSLTAECRVNAECGVDDSANQ